MVVERSAPITIASEDGRLGASKAQETFVSWLIDILLYIVVLNLFVESVPRIVIDSFTVSILTAIVLKLLIVAIFGLEQRVSAWFEQHEGPVWRALRLTALWAILFFSKFVVLEVIDIVFGDTVELGGFITIAVLIVTMILSRLAMDLVYQRLATVPDR